MQRTLKHSTEIDVKFSEADPLGIVWHGHYIRYFEDAREDFGKKFGISYLDLYRKHIVVPIVNIQCDYKRILRYGHSILIETTYKDSLAAKLEFDYSIFDLTTKEQVATGQSTQVFLNKDSLELMLTIPPFIQEWKDKWLK